MSTLKKIFPYLLMWVGIALMIASGASMMLMLGILFFVSSAFVWLDNKMEASK